MNGEQSTDEAEHPGGTPGAFAEDHVRVHDGPMTVNYHGRRRYGHGEYSAQCPVCGDWHSWHNEDGAIREAKRCCGGANRSVERGGDRSDE